MKNLTFHNIPPVFDHNSKVLILGSFPSVKSREQAFFYGHQQNRFWQVLAKLKQDKIPESIEEKREFLLKYNIAVWDVIKSCEIVGSSDSSIKNVVPNDIKIILEKSKIKKIYTNGKTSYKYYEKYIESDIKIKAICLPSTSPANASYSLDDLCEKWRQVFEDN